MSLYTRGLAVRPASQEQRPWANYHVGALIATPGTIKAETNQLNAEVAALDKELGAIRASWGTVRDVDLPEPQATMDRWWHANWVPFLAEWDKFWQTHGNTWGLANWYHNFWGSTWEKVQDYRRRLIELRRSAAQVGYTFVGPEPTAPKEGWASAAAGEVWGLVKVLFWAGLLIVGGIVIFKFMGR